MGSATSKTISSEGGTLLSTDSRLLVSIPAGAVAAPTEFTITPIASTARGAVGGGYRLGPEGTTFAAPITLTFKGLDEYPFGASIADIGVEYQDAQGFWQRAEPATRDVAANTVSVPTEHFSDWTITWQSGIPVAEGPIRIVQSVGVPFDGQGRATVYLQSDSPTFTSYVLAGTLTVPQTITVGTEVCTPEQITSSWANIAEIDKGKGVFRWGTGARWALSCSLSGTRTMPASFDTLGINLSQCVGTYDPGQIADLDFLQGAYTTNCGTRGTVRGTWRLSGYQILVDPISGLVTTEAGGTATFQISLNKAPTADVVVPLSSSVPTEGAVPASVTFTPANWSTPQVVTVTGVDDFVIDGNIPYTILTGAATSADPHYAGIDPDDVAVTNLDNDVAGLVATPSTGLTTTEAGGTATFQLTLRSQPLADVVVSISSTDTTEGTVAPASVTFTAASWNVAQTVTVTGVDDFVADGNVAYTVQLSATSGDANYAGVSGSVSVTNLDNDATGITVGSPSSTTTSEAGATATFTLVLTSQPTSDVTIPLSSSNTAEGTVFPSNVTFTALNWSTPQTVTVTGVDDLVADGPQTYVIVIGPATSLDAGYSGTDPADLTFTNLDNDVAGLVATPSAGLVTTEAGGTATFQLTLGSQPLADVVVSLSSNDPTEGIVAPATVTFTAANWNVSQTVTVTGVDDLVADGDVAYTAQMSATSTDPKYAGVSGSVSVTNLDNDATGIPVGTPSSTTTSEAGTTATFTLVLTSQPTFDVTIPLSSSNTAEGTVFPSNVTFTALNWSTPQTVTVTGMNDFVVDGDKTYVITIGPATSADAGYSGKSSPSLTFTNTDNDTAGITVIPPGSLFTSESGTSVTFTVALSSQPTADVTIPLSSSNTAEGTVFPSNVTFTALNWSTPQTVTVTGVNDFVADGNQTYVIAIGPATSADAGYSGKSAPGITFTNTDNDTAGITASPPSGLFTSESGTSVTFTVVLNSQPTADVAVPLLSSKPAEGTVSSASLVFTAANWSTPQTVTVTGVDDLVADGPQIYFIAIGPATSSDPTYQGLGAPDIQLTNDDNDVPGQLKAFPSSGLVTTEAGGTATFQLTLSSPPAADVVVSLLSSNTAEGTVAPTTVLFTSADWNVPQVVTVTGVSDGVVDPDVPYLVQLSASSLDPTYDLATAMVSVTNLNVN